MRAFNFLIPRFKVLNRVLRPAKAALSRKYLGLFGTAVLFFPLSVSLPLQAEPSAAITSVPVPQATATAATAAGDDAVEEIKKKYSRKGADTCLKCHDEDYAYSVMDIFATKHGNRNDPRAPMAQLECETCHGPGRAHAGEPKVGQQRAPILSFSDRSTYSIEQQNAPCLRCHANAVANWQSSVHDRQRLRCTSCHRIHAKKDPVITVKNQATVCYQCHAQQRSEFQRLSAHPVGFADMRCASCHNPHGSLNPTLLRANTINGLCYGCHAEKRGPFLWLHAPVQEDCGICHEKHGSAQASLLKQRPPFLCQSCHSMAGHPSISFSGSDTPAGFNGSFVMAKSCLNCHFQIHGSNHPSGVKFMR